MKAFTCLALVLLIGVATSARAPGRIAGGSDADLSEYAMVVQVDNLVGIIWRQSCAGSILTSRYILSAASCFSGLLFSRITRRIRVGASERGEGGEISGLDNVFNHPGFGASGLDRDISIVRLSEVLSYTEYIQPGFISAAGVDLPENIPLTLLGWGQVDEDTNAEVLQSLSALTIARSTCAEAFETGGNVESLQITENMLCVAASEGEGACDGDVGGPAVYEQEPYNIIMGVISWPGGCRNTSYPTPTVATAVSPFTEWILENAV